MADNVAITEGSGTSVAADEISSVKYQRIKIVQGADGVNDGDTAEALPLPVRNAPVIYVGQTTTRPADNAAYAAGDLIATSTTAGSVTFKTVQASRKVNGLATAIKASLSSTRASPTTTNAVFRVHLFNAAPTDLANGDNGAFNCSAAGHVGSFDITYSKAFTDMAKGYGFPSDGYGITYTPVSGANTLYYVIEARAAYTPASEEVFTFSLEVL